MKKLFSLMLCFVLLFSLTVPASASTGNARLLEYQYIDTITANLIIDRFWGVATCEGTITVNGDHPAYVEVYLQQLTSNGWETVRSWTGEGQGHAYAGGSCAIAKGYQYRTYTSVYVYSGSTIIDTGYATYSENYF